MIASPSTLLNVGNGSRLYLCATRHVQRLPPKLRAAYEAMWLGLLDTQALNEITRLFYLGPTGFDSEEHNFRGLWSWEEEVVRRHFFDCHRILVAGAGGGREVIALAKLGYSVTAFDFCDTLTRACRRHVEDAGISAQVVDAPPDALPEGLDVYDAVFAGRGLYHHIPSRGRRIAFLRACRQHIEAHGPLFLSDFFIRPCESSGHRTYSLSRTHSAGFGSVMKLWSWATGCRVVCSMRLCRTRSNPSSARRAFIRSSTPFCRSIRSRVWRMPLG